MILHLWDKAADPLPWIEPEEMRPVFCGLLVNYQEITRDPDNCTCSDCDAALDLKVLAAWAAEGGSTNG